MKSTTILPRQGRFGLRRVGFVLAALVLAALVSALPARAQGQMVLEADELIYNYDADYISALGNVIVEYLNYVLTADRLTFYQTTGRLVAVGNVRIVDAEGNVFEAAQADVTQDFREGFIQQLYVVTADNIYFSAETSRRTGGNVTEFFNATYTACEVRFDEGSRTPFWNVRAARIVHDGEERMVYFEQARLEFLGVPIAFVPRLSTPDPSVTRATGFLFPEVAVSSSLGWGVGVPFFWAPAPNYDLTLTPTYFTKAGVLVEAEWRHRLRTGIYTFTGAGIYERVTGPGDPGFRGAIRGTGDFNIGRFWNFGWDGTLMTDRAFAADYGTVNNAAPFVRSEIRLTGVLDASYFDANAYYFQNVADPTLPRNDQARQAAVYPVVDFEHVMPFFGGQLTYTANLTNLSRGANDSLMIGPDTYFHGLAGNYTRITQQLMWERRIIAPLGQVFTPFAFARADLYFLDLDAPPAGVTTDSFAARLTGGVGFEWSWPFLVEVGNTQHIIEPVIQFVARPSEAMIGALPNEDAQSIIFDTTNLLALNRFSGGDRFEGGTRLVVLLRYSGQFGEGHIEAVIGQSYQLAGLNSYAIADVNNPGMGTGLGSTMSHIVAALTATDRTGRTLAIAGRFDPATFELQRGLLSASGALGPVSAGVGLIYERSVVDVEGVAGAAFLITGRAALEVGQWTLNGTVDYDAIAGHVVADSIGLRYACDCAAFSVTYSESRAGGLVTDRRVMFGLQLRTLGDFDFAQR